MVIDQSIALEGEAQADAEHIKPRVLALSEESANRAPAAYALATLLEIAGARVEQQTYAGNGAIQSHGIDAVVSYGVIPPTISGPAHLHIRASGFFGPNKYLKPHSVPSQRFDYDGITALYTDSVASPRLKSDSAVLDVDIVASAFVFLTCYQEIVTAGSIDKRGRRSAEESFQIRLDLIDRPIVNEYAQYIAATLEEMSPRLELRPPHWGVGGYAFAVTRDIDSDHKFQPTSIRQLAYLAAHGKLQGLSRSISGALGALGGRKDPHDNIGPMRDWERSLGIRSSLYFLSSEIAGDANYKLSDLSARWKFDELTAEGWEIGFHPGCRAFSSDETFQDEKRRFDEAVPSGGQGGRQHGLRFIAPHTWRYWEKAGFRYDSTLGFPEREGFKCGVCVPFRPFDVLENRVLDLWEVPLILMDSTVLKYRRFDAAKTRDSASRLLEQVKKHHGVFVLLWHNTCFGPGNGGWLHGAFEGLVQRAVKDGAMVAPVRDLLDRWEEWVRA